MTKKKKKKKKNCRIKVFILMPIRELFCLQHNTNCHDKHCNSVFVQGKKSSYFDTHYLPPHVVLRSSLPSPSNTHALPIPPPPSYSSSPYPVPSIHLSGSVTGVIPSDVELQRTSRKREREEIAALTAEDAGMKRKEMKRARAMIPLGESLCLTSHSHYFY